MSLHFRDQRGAAFIRQRNRTENCVLMYEQKPYPGQCEHNYSLHGIGWCCVELLHGGISPSSIMSLRRKNEMKKDVQQSFDQQSKLI